MKAIDFIVTRAKMCDYYGGVLKGCAKGGENCPLKAIDCDITADMSVGDAEKMQAIVEKWAHRKDGTNEDKFKTVFGEDFIDIWTLSSTNAHEWASKKYEGE